MNIAYMTASAPYGKGESFVLTEIDELLRVGHSIVILPVHPKKECFVQGYNVWPESLFSLKVFFWGFLAFVTHPLLVSRAIWHVLSQSGSISNTIRNIAVIPKSLAASRFLCSARIDCIHAHWLSTPSTMAYIVSRICKIPCIATAHRWDIYNKNAPIAKTEQFAAVRVISARGKRDFLSSLPPELHHKVHLIHMGIDVPEVSSFTTTEHTGFHIAMTAYMLPRKGHIYALEAIRMLKDKGYTDVILHLFGDGEGEESLRTLVTQWNLQQQVIFHGNVPHRKLLEKYRIHDVDCVLLSSYDENGEAGEGIPISLIEAMGYEIPVIATDVGGNPEFLNMQTGVPIPQKDAQAIADAILRLKSDRAYAGQIAKEGRLLVESEFNQKTVIVSLEKMMESARGSWYGK